MQRDAFGARGFGALVHRNVTFLVVAADLPDDAAPMGSRQTSSMPRAETAGLVAHPGMKSLMR
jgi:hypothetical protein